METDNFPPYVLTKEEGVSIKKRFEIKSGITYVRSNEYSPPKSKEDGETYHFVDKRKVVCDNEHPFSIIHTDVYECMYGRERHAARKERIVADKEKRLQEDHPLPVKRAFKRCQASRKKGCPAKLILKEVVMYTDYKYMERRAQFTGDLSNMKWTLGIIQSARQRDGHSCGAFVMMNALAVVKGVDPTKLGNKAAAMRVYVQHQLLENSISPKQPLRICDMLTCALSPVRQHKDEPWVRCDVCGRWLHLKCVALEKPPPAEDDYVCPVCLAQYH